MTEPMDKATKDLIEGVAQLVAAFSPFLTQNKHRPEIERNIAKSIQSFLEEKLKQQDQATIQAIDALTKQIAELMERLKQERNKVIDECIDAIFDKMIEVGPNKRFSYKECKTILQSIKDQIHEPEAKTKDSQKPY